MASSTNKNSFTELKSVEFYSFKNTSCQLKVVRSEEYNKIYIGFHKFSTYADSQTGEVKNTHNFVNFPLVAVAELLQSLLANVYNFAKEQQDGVIHILK
jgi:hypothetical protein